MDSVEDVMPPKRSIGQAEIESSFYKYDGTFSDHLEMLVQMGYVVLFSAAFPLAGVCALANNLLEIRSDAFKLAHVHQVNTKAKHILFEWLKLKFHSIGYSDHSGSVWPTLALGKMHSVFLALQRSLWIVPWSVCRDRCRDSGLAWHLLKQSFWSLQWSTWCSECVRHWHGYCPNYRRGWQLRSHVPSTVATKCSVRAHRRGRHHRLHHRMYPIHSISIKAIYPIRAQRMTH